MIRLEDFDQHLLGLSKDDWGKLLSLIPRVRSANTFGIIEQESPLFLKVKHCKIVDEIMDTLSSLQLFPIFEWIIWKDGRQILQNASFNFKTLSIKELCMLLSVIYRLDEFNEGYLVSKFEDGTMLSILEALEKRVIVS